MWEEDNAESLLLGDDALSNSEILDASKRQGFPPPPPPPPTEQPPPLTFYGDYLPMNGIPTRCIKPSYDSTKFTSRAFSADGCCLATGENNGTIRIWHTSDYSLINQTSDLFERPIDILSFVDGRNDLLIAIDTRGRLLEFGFHAMMDEEGTSSQEPSGQKSARVYRELNTERITDDGRRLHIATRQFSEDGRTLVCGTWEPGQPIDAYRFEESTHHHLAIHGELSSQECIFPILSKSGKGLLASSVGRNEFRNPNAVRPHLLAFTVYVWPRLDFRSGRNTQRIALSGDRAVWGAKGKYLLLWNPFNPQPRLSVYRTEQLRKRMSAPPIAPPRKLDIGLADWKAQMIDPHTSDENIQVLICEINKKDERKFSIWDVTENTVTREVIVKLRPRREIRKANWSLYGQSAEALVECGTPVRSLEAFFCLLMDDVYPKFCISKDRTWIGVFSWSYHCCSVASMESTVTVWEFVLPDEVSVDPFQMYSQAIFDPTGHHFLMLNNCAIMACAPSFLASKNSQWKSLKSSPADLFTYSDKEREHMIDTFASLSSEALAEIMSQPNEDGSRQLLFPFDTSQLPEIVFVRDAAVSGEGHQLAFIAYGRAGVTLIVAVDTRDFRQGNVYVQKPTLGVFPIDAEGFDPGRVFFYQEGSDEVESFVLFSAGFKPVALFCNVKHQESTRVELEMDRCHRIAQTEDRKRMLLLDIRSVCIVDLQKQQVTERISYAADFKHILKKLRPARKYLHKGSIYRDKNFERRISDDGRSVLLSWDTLNNRSIVVTPSTELNEVDQLLGATGKTLSDFCVISRNARCTMFIDFDEALNGRIVVGIFDQRGQSVTHRICLEENVPMKEMSHEDLQSFFSGVFYDLSKDGTELIAATTCLTSMKSPVKRKDLIRRFNIYATETCLANYDRLASNTGQTPEESVQRELGRFGPCVSNAPVRNGRSLFHEMFLMRNREMLDCLRRLVGGDGGQLALEWKKSDAGPSNLMESVLQSNSTNEIREVTELAGSNLTPFGRSAEIMKHSFKALLADHLEIVEHALSKNILITEACTVRVHVDFLNEELRRDTAVHIDTSDTFLEWHHIQDPKLCEETWRAKNEDVINRMEEKGNRSTREASLRFVSIEDAAKIGMRGIIRPLLLQHAPDYIFKLDAVKSVVLYKWFKIWKSEFIKDFISYVVFLVFFTAYALLVASMPNVHQHNEQEKVAGLVLLLIVFCFGFWMFHEETRQIRTLMKDGRRYFSGSYWGVRHFFRSRWNWADLISCFLLLVLIPVFHVATVIFDVSLFGRCLTTVVALESIFVYIKLWYFAQPFRVTGALVLLIDNIIKDCFWFLALAFVVLCGFGLALHVAFREVTGGTELKEQVSEMFETPWRSLVTLFYALLGAFEPEIYRSQDVLNWLTTGIFTVYLIAQTIVLLNLLIAIMSDTFDRVKSTEEAQLLKGRALFIDACEAALTESKREEMDKRIGKYVHVLVDANEEPERDPSAQWTGRVNIMEESLRMYIRKTERSLKELYETGEERMKQHVDTSTREMENRLREERSKKHEERETKMSEFLNEIGNLWSHMQQEQDRMTQMESRINEMQETTTHQLQTILSLLQKSDEQE